MADPKYANLPGIDLSSPDVFETSDLPEDEQDLATSETTPEVSNDNVDRPSLDAKAALGKFKDKHLQSSNIDFSDRISESTKTGYDSTKTEYEMLEEGASKIESPQQKYQRLQHEIRELTEEVHRIQDNVKQESTAEKMSPVSLSKQLEYLQHQLNDLHLEKLLGPEASVDLSDPQGALQKMYRYGNNTYAAEVGNKGDKKDPDHQCDTCGRRFFTTEQLSRHVRNLHGPTLHCPRPNCGYTCPKTRAYRMREHIHKQHEIPEMESQSQARGTSTAKDKTKTKSKSRSKSEPRTTISSVVAPATPIPTVETLDDCDPIDMSVAGNLDQPAHTWNSPGFTISGLAHGLDFSPTLLGSLPDELLFMDAPMPEVTPGQVRCTSPSLQQQPRPSGAAVTKLNRVSVGNQAVQESETKATQVGPDHVTQATQTHVPGTSSKQQQTDPEKLHYLANHPAYFFMGAPSVYMQGSTAELLRGTRQEALQQQNRYRRRWVPHGYICITKKESVTMPDGRIYSLEDTWVRQPVCARLTSTATQTDERKRRMEPEDDQPLDLSKKARVEERLLTQIGSYRSGDKKAKESPKKGGAAATSDCVTYELYYRQEQAQFSKNARLASLEERLERLEAAIGQNQEKLSVLTADTNNKSLVGAVATVNAKLSLLEMSNIEQVEARLQGVLHRLTQIAEKKTAQEDVEKQNKIAELYDLVKKWNSVSDTMPQVVERLAALKELHEQALQFSQGLAYLDTAQQEISTSLNAHGDMMKQLQGTFQQNMDAMKANCASLDSRIKALQKK